ncbi:MAG: TIGR01777 family protein [Gammaproteobacteria bacterium]|jgi:uncharacterized protein (TIGR01777 family)|nr:MAG: TIGR01777 family protein [Gammaproteobacteria bacterium]
MSDQPDDNQDQPDARPSVVIAGGRGFIGRRLAAVLGGDGYDVVILTRGPARQPVGPISFANWQPSHTGQSDEQPDAALIDLISGSQAVVNLCGESIGGPRWTDKRKALLIDSRVGPTETLVGAINAADDPPGVLVQASGVGFYGTGNKAVDESSGSGGDFLADLARQWEAPLTSLREEVRPVLARLGVVLGKGGGALGQMLMPFKLFVGGPIAKGTQWLSWIHLHDAAAILKALIEDPESRGPYNVVAPNPVRNIDFAESAGAALGRPTWMFTPRFALNALLGEQATLVCDGQQAVSTRLRHNFEYPDIEAALSDLV